MTTQPIPVSAVNLSDFLALPETLHTNILRAKEALDAVAWLANAATEKALKSDSKDTFISLPSDSLASLVWCIAETIDCDGLYTISPLNDI